MADMASAVPSEEFLKAMMKDTSLGPFWGSFGACLLQGYIFHLAVRYFQLPASWWERLAVSTGFVGTVMGTALVTYDMYQQTVSFYSGFQNMGFYPWMAGANCQIGGIVTLCTQAIFAFRLIRLHHGNKLLAIPLVTLIIGTYASHFPWTHFLWAPNGYNMEEFGARVTPFLYAEYSMTAITDVILCVGTTWTLAKMQRAALPQTKTKLKLLSYYAVESMVLPTACAIGAVALKISRPLTSEHYIFLYWQKFVSMTVLLLVLLSREELSKDSSIDMASSSDSHPSSKPTVLSNFTESKTTVGNDSASELGMSKTRT